MNRILLVAVLAALTMTARATPPDIRKCITPDGGTLYGDDADQCKDAPIRTLDSNGTPKELIASPPTAEERKAKEEGERKKADRDRQNKDRFKDNEALLDRYPSEDDLQEARYRALGDQIGKIDQANDRLKKLVAKARDFAEKVKFFEPPHRMPDDLRKDRDLNRELEQSEFQRIADAAHEIERINDRYDADLKRYRELVNDMAKVPPDLKKK